MNNVFYNNLFNKIQEFDNIALFVHELPDADALGSSFAFKEWIEINFKNKKVSVIGMNKIPKGKINNFFKNIDNTEFNDAQLKNSLGIIFDTANKTRVHTQKNNLCKYTFRIDHHPKIETFCNEELIDSNSSSTCELVGYIIKYFNNCVNNKIISYLYLGILTDSNRFLFPNTTKKTYELASWFTDFNFNKEKIHNLIYLNNLSDLKINNNLFKKAKFKNEVGYMVIRDKTIQTSKVYLLENIKEVKIWTSIYYDYQLKTWKGSIRSRNIKINHIAQKFNGGGHVYAAGFKLKNKKDFKQLVSLLIEEVKNNEMSTNK